jgi:predicted nucleotidyltransferase
VTQAGFADDPNLHILDSVARALGELCESLVFVGGCASGLLLTAQRSELIRATQDVDVVAQLTSIAQYHRLEKAIEARGFARDRSSEAPICRWVRAGVKLDLMPSEPLLGFHNRWYPLAVETASVVTLPTGATIRLIAAPVFVATKLEAFHGRGARDFLASHDLEDLLTVIDGREELLTEARESRLPLREYLAAEMTALLATEDFLQAIPGHLPGDRASQARAPILLQRLSDLGQLGSGGRN